MAGNDRAKSEGTATRPGTVAVGSCHDDRLSDLLGGRTPRSMPVGDEPWSLVGQLLTGAVADEAMHSGALDAALRGADVIVEVDATRVAAFVDDIQRLGINLWHPPTADATAAEWAPLLDELATGATTEEAARRCHLSLRSAHRRLAVARTVLGAPTTAAAIARWSASDR